MGKHVIRLLTVFAGAVLASTWWAAAWWGSILVEPEHYPKPAALWFLAAIMTGCATVFVFFYVVVHWEE